MEKIKKVYLSKRERSWYIASYFVLASGFIWMITTQKYYLLINLIPLLALYFFTVKTYRITDDGQLLHQHTFGRAFRPVALKDFHSYRIPSKNELTLYYKGGSRTLRLNEDDIEEILAEVKKNESRVNGEKFK